MRMSRIPRILLAMAVVLSFTWIYRHDLKHSFNRHSHSRMLNSQKRLVDPGQVVISTPPAHDYTSFVVSDVIGREVLYERVQCGEDLFRPGCKIPNLIHYVWFGIFQISRMQYYAIR